MDDAKCAAPLARARNLADLIAGEAEVIERRGG